jgi:Flp pilus assembly protein TadB
VSEFIERQRPVIERSGMGLLPGIALALVLAIGLIAAIVVKSWWIVACVLVGVFVITGVVLAVIVGLLGKDEDIYSHD